MTPAKKKKVMLGAGALGLLLLAMQRRTGKGTVQIGPVAVTDQNVSFDQATEAAIQRSALANAQSRKMMGADPNTLVSRQPSSSELVYIQGAIDLAKRLALISQGKVPYSDTVEKMLSLARTLPGDTLQKGNAEFYGLLGIDPANMNEPTRALTPASEARARALIAKWRPYSQPAVDALFVQLDEARELGGSA